MISAYQLEIDFTLLVGQLILFLALLAFEAVFDLWIAPKRGYKWKVRLKVITPHFDFTYAIFNPSLIYPPKAPSKWMASRLGFKNKESEIVLVDLGIWTPDLRSN